MSMQRTTQQSLRKFALSQHGIFSRTALCKLAGPAAIATSSHLIQARYATTQNIKPDDGYEILVKQRLNRPLSPHLRIYQPQIPWILSITHRITGAALSGGFYIFGFSYLIAPLMGWHLESGALAAAFGSLPLLAKAGIKFAVAMPFTFHSWNGIRHIVWDSGRQFTNQQVIRSGYLVLGLTVLTSGILAYM